MNEKEFLEYLEIYGADISSWPQNLRQNATAAIERNPAIRSLLRQEEDFEKILNSREVEMHSPDLQNRIIASARTNTIQLKNAKSLWNYLNEIFISLNLPKPALSAGIVIIIGIMLGYLIDNSQIANFQDESDSGVTSLYEGEIYEFEG